MANEKKEGTNFKTSNLIKITKWRCFLIGHSHKEELNDSGYAICDRCGMHEYYDNEKDLRSWPRMNDYPIWHPVYNKFISIKDFFSFKKNEIKEFFFGKTWCSYCETDFLTRKFKNGECPRCGQQDDLPF